MYVALASYTLLTAGHRHRHRHRLLIADLIGFALICS